MLIVGLGLLGGSYAKVLKKKGIAVNAITLEQRDIDYALTNGMIDRGTTEIDTEMISQADLVVFAVYPHVFLDWIKEHGHLFRAGQVITDRDLTRIAKINDDMWSELFLANQQTLLEQMEAYRSQFDRMYDCIQDGDREGIREMMRLSTARRQLFEKKV